MDRALEPGTSGHTLPDGRQVSRIVLADGTLSVALLSLGAVVQDVRLRGVGHSLTVGSPDIDAYAGPLRSCGALVGPIANRIGGGSAALDGLRHDFERNQDGRHTLHGGAAGINRRVWEIAERTDTAVTLALTLIDGDGGFPGNRVLAARFALTKPGTLELRVTATTDAPTWLNIANHSYWNLDGTDRYTGHRLRLDAGRYLPTDADSLVTGEIAAVAGTPFDFRDGRDLTPGSDVRYDHNFCVAEARRAPVEVLRLTGASGVSMALETTEPGVQIYDAEGLDGGGAARHGGGRIGRFAGLAIEAQGWPDAPNTPAFPSVVVRPARAYEQITRWRFAAP